MEPGLQTNKKTGLHALFSYLMATFTGALGLLNWLLFRSFVLDFLPHSTIKKEAWRAVDNFTFVIFGILWLFLVLFGQHYYKKGLQRRKSGHHFFLITGIQLLLLMVCQVAPYILGWNKWNLSALLYPFIECVLGVGLIILMIRMTCKRKTNSSI